MSANYEVIAGCCLKIRELWFLSSWVRQQAYMYTSTWSETCTRHDSWDLHVLWNHVASVAYSAQERWCANKTFCIGLTTLDKLCLCFFVSFCVMFVLCLFICFFVWLCCVCLVLLLVIFVLFYHFLKCAEYPQIECKAVYPAQRGFDINGSTLM